MLARCRVLELAPLFVLLAVTGCKTDGAATNAIPEALRGAYGRKASDAFVTTLGLEVDVDTLRYSGMTIKILEGKALSDDDFQVTLAELAWAKSDKKPRECKGTIAKQGNQLLITLFKTVGDDKCDPNLNGEWKAWKPTKAFPEALRGTFGSKDPYSREEGTVVEEALLRRTWGSADLELAEAVAFVGVEDELIVRDSAFGETRCRGTIHVEDDQLSGELEIIPDTEAADAYCPPLRGQRWTVEANRLPQKTLANGSVRIEMKDGKVILSTTDDQGLRCEQEVLRTSTRSVARSGRDGIPVMGGTVLLLDHAEPKAGASGCQERLGGLASARCEELMGAPCDASMIGGGAEPPAINCPTHLVLGDPDANGRKVAFLPQDLQTAVCWETKEYFKE